METIDFSSEIASHVIWNTKLRGFFDDTELISEDEIISHKDCNLGKWLSSEGMDKYSHILEIEEIQGLHIKFHEIVKQIVNMKSYGDTIFPERGLAELKLVSRKIISLLLTIEEKIHGSGYDIEVQV